MDNQERQTAVGIGSGPGSTLSAFDELLRRPADAMTRSEAGGGLAVSLRLFGGSIAGYVLYGAIAGLFQGGVQTLIAALKTPLIVVGSLLLCAPSFYVFGTLAGADLSARRFLGLMAGFGGVLALLMMGLLPVTWLFTVSSSSLVFVVWLHVLIWWIALLFGFRFLVTAEPRARGALFLWVLLFSIVSYQLTTHVRPVLWREPGAPVFETEKLFFLEHLGEVGKPARR